MDIPAEPCHLLGPPCNQVLHLSHHNIRDVSFGFVKDCQNQVSWAAVVAGHHLDWVDWRVQVLPWPRRRRLLPRPPPPLCTPPPLHEADFHHRGHAACHHRPRPHLLAAVDLQQLGQRQLLLRHQPRLQHCSDISHHRLALCPSE